MMAVYVVRTKPTHNRSPSSSHHEKPHKKTYGHHHKRKNPPEREIAKFCTGHVYHLLFIPIDGIANEKDTRAIFFLRNSNKKIVWRRYRRRINWRIDCHRQLFGRFWQYLSGFSVTGKHAFLVVVKIAPVIEDCLKLGSGAV